MALALAFVSTHTGAVRRSRIALVSGVVALVVVAVLAVMLADRPAEIFEPGSVEASVQTYTRSVLDGDRDTAWAMLTSRYQVDLTRRCRDGPLQGDHPMDLRVSLLEVKIDTDFSTVHAGTTESFSGGAFGLPSEYSHEDRFELMVSNGAWLIDQAPWSLEICE